MSSPPIPWKHVRTVTFLFAPLWAGSALLFGVTGLGYAWVRSELWEARQPLVVRDEAGRSVERLGRFASQSELKAAQETLLEMARSPEVVAAALRSIGPPPGLRPPRHGEAAVWPSQERIDAVASSWVNVMAPKGSEFGNTEVVYMHVKAESRSRAAAFSVAMLDHLKEYLREVRRVRADSIVSELTEARDLAQKDLDSVAARMRKIEVEFGSDLGELRSLSEMITGDGTNRRELETTTRELQQAELELRKLESLHELLLTGTEDPQQLLISGHELLSSQPSLERLKTGLLEAQLRTSQLAGTLTADNPKLRAAISHENEIRDRIREEAESVVRAMRPTLRLERDRVARLQDKAASLRGRLQKLAGSRTDYATLEAEMRHRSEQLASAESALAEAEATRSASMATNLLVALGPPQVADRPAGASASVLTLAGTSAGLIFGFGIVFLVAPGPEEPRHGRRWSDYLGGRRSSDVNPVTTLTPSPHPPGEQGFPPGGPNPRPQANPGAESRRGGDRRVADRRSHRPG